MFVRIANSPRDYAWGSVSGIPDLLGYPVTGAPQAELWLGDHPGSPARVVDPVDAEHGGTLAQVASGRLPFLLKVLAAETALSLQAHPTRAQAVAGFRRETEAGVPLGAAERNYKDANHKPELIVAATETFDALSGFRPVADTRTDLQRLPSTPAIAGFVDRLTDDTVLRDVFAWLVTRGDGVDALVTDVVAGARQVAGADGVDTLGFGTVRDLADLYPGDPGIVSSLLLHRIRLHRGEALYLPAGNIHAYLHGVGIELMAASDNVLRGGLTPKHVDTDELLAVLDFIPGPEPRLVPVELSPGVRVFRPDVPDFTLTEVDLTAAGGAVDVVTPGPAITLVLAGTVTVTDGDDTVTLTRGDALYTETDELDLSGDAHLVTATPGS